MIRKPAAVSGAMIRDLHLCGRKVALEIHVGPSLRDPVSTFTPMLWHDGLAHKAMVVNGLGDGVIDLPPLSRTERLNGTIGALRAKAPVILESVIEHDDMIGMPDLLRWPPTGYLASDVKAGAAPEGSRQSYKKDDPVQVAHYAHIPKTSELGRGDVGGIVDRTGVETLYDQSAPHGCEREAGTETHLRLLEHARHVRVNGDTSRGALAASRGMCEWKSFSKMELTKADDLTRIAGLGRAVREKVETFAGTVTGLAGLDPMSFPLLPGVGPDRLRRFVERDSRISDPTAGPIVRMPPNLPRPGHGIDFDVEADPLRKLMYVYGLWHVVGGEGRFVHFFAETADEAGEHEAFAEAISHFRKYRNAHWVHYSAYERTAYRALQQRHPMVREVEQIDLIIAAERCTDLYPIIAQHTDWPLSSYGIKSVVRACGFEWEDADPGSANCIEWYEGLVETDDTALRDHIVTHNRDDVIDSQVVGDALDELETTGMIAAFRRPAK